jgi:hypothetical protein
VAALAEAFNDDVEDINESIAAFKRWESRMARSDVPLAADRVLRR